MKILWIMHEIPEDTFGARKRYLYLIRSVVQAGHSVHAVFGHPGGDCGELEKSMLPLTGLGVRYTPLPLATPGEPASSGGVQSGHWLRSLYGTFRQHLRKIKAIGVSLCTSQPRAAFIPWLPRLRELVRELLAQEQYELVIIEHLDYAYLHRSVPTSLPTVMNTHNVLTHVALREATLSRSKGSNVLQRLLWQLDYLKLAMLERYALGSFSLVTVVSKLDGERISRWRRGTRTMVVENGVDSSRFANSGTRTNPGSVVFSGLMSYQPNADGARWFLLSIWPEVVRRHSEAHLTIVGAEPPEDLVRLAKGDPTVTVTGWVEDVKPYLASAALVIAPLRLGGGTRLKILEAASMGRAVVSTTMAAEGIDDLRNGQELLLADAPADFADAVCKILDDPGLATSLGLSAREAICKHYDWEVVGEKFLASLNSFSKAAVVKPPA